MQKLPIKNSNVISIRPEPPIPEIKIKQLTATDTSPDRGLS